jgi:hypothetical protein
VLDYTTTALFAGGGVATVIVLWNDDDVGEKVGNELLAPAAGLTVLAILVPIWLRERGVGIWLLGVAALLAGAAVIAPVCLR